MAVKPTLGSNFFLELNGTVAGALRSAQPPAIEFARGAARRASRSVSVGSFSASSAVMPGAMMDWVLSVMAERAPSAPLANGALIYTDLNMQARRRVDWTGGAITEIKFSDLDATSGKLPFDVNLAWQPKALQFVAGAGKVASTKAVKGIIAANFRVLGLPFSDNVLKIQLPLVTTQLTGTKAKTPYAGITLGELRIEVAPGVKGELLDYISGVIADGKLTGEEYLDLSIELLDPSLAKVLATVSLKGCGLLRIDQPKEEGGKEALQRYTLTFSVELFDLNFTSVK